MRKSIRALVLSILMLSGCSTGNSSTSVYSSSSSDLPSSSTEVEVVFKNYDGTILLTKNVQKGSDVIFDGTIPTKLATTSYTYSFKGWDKPLTNIVVPTVFSATYETSMQNLEDEQGLIYEPVDDSSYKVVSYNKNKYIYRITVPKKFNDFPVTSLENGLFNGCDTVEDILCYSTLKYIKTGAFYNCAALKYIGIYPNADQGNDELIIHTRAVIDCPSLTNIDIFPSSIRIEEHAFYNTPSLHSVFFNSEIEPNYINAGAFNATGSINNTVAYCKFKQATKLDWTKDFRDYLLGYYGGPNPQIKCVEFGGSSFFAINSSTYIGSDDAINVVASKYAHFPDPFVLTDLHGKIFSIPSSYTDSDSTKAWPVSKLFRKSFYGFKNGGFLIPSSVTEISSYAFGSSDYASSEWDLDLFCDCAEKQDGWADNWNGRCRVHYYSETEATGFWHYVNDIPTIWN